MDILRDISSLPAAAIADEVNAKLASSSCLVVTAPPGAGKSTVLPLTILRALDGQDDGKTTRLQTATDATPGRILMLEPRRLAARQIAERMAWMLGESAGQTVGYRVRFESKVSSQTRIEVLTEGILTRMLVDDPTLEGVDVVIFDEFHERSLVSDEALALTREAQKVLRPDLRIVVMSATIDTAGLCGALQATLVEGKGRMFPVETRHITPTGDICADVAHVIRQAHREQEGDILAFLPGEAEIRRCAELLGEALSPTGVYPLYGMLPFEEQRRAIAPSAPGERKVVLATPIAETSLTIEGVRVVVDSGLHRKMQFDPQTGLSRLVTMPVSMDMAVQRTGRAGRVAPGVCYRLWTLATEERMAPDRIPEILEADLAPLLLDIAAWGGSADELEWITPPPAFKLAAATDLLKMLGALDDAGRITAHGRRLASLPCHPRIAQMLAGADERKSLAADIAAVLEEKDPLTKEGADSDLSLRISALRRARQGNVGSWGRIAKIASQYCGMVRCREDNSPVDPYMVGALVASAYPERVGKARSDGRGRFLLACGEEAFTDHEDSIASCEWIAAASVSSANVSSGSRAGTPRDAGRIFLAAPLDPADLRPMLSTRDNVSWDSRRGAVVARREKGIGCLTVESQPIHDSARERIVEVICEAARKDGLSMLDFSDAVQNLQRRVAAVALWHPELELPDLGTEAVLGRASDWLPLYLDGATTAAEMKKIDLETALWGLLDYEQQKAVERIAPSHIEVPTGSRIRLEYRQGADAPVLRVRLQECFGLLDTPRVDGGRLPVLMELLSPGFKPVQLTTDLRSFWQGTYFEVRKELKRRYPKHSWPDDPIAAEAVRGVKKKV